MELEEKKMTPDSYSKTQVAAASIALLAPTKFSRLPEKLRELRAKVKMMKQGEAMNGLNRLKD